MTIRRDYNRPFFHKRRNRGRLYFIVFMSALIVGLLLYVSLRFDQLQLQALDSIGMAPTPTPFASDLATDGMALYGSGNVGGALTLIERAAQQQPNNVDYLYEYGRLLLENEREDEAVTIGDRMVELAPNDPRSYEIRAAAVMYSDPAEAIQVTIRGQEADELYAPLMAIQGVAYTNLGRWQEGTRQSYQAVELAPNNAFVLRASYTPLVYVAQYQQAADNLTRAIELNPNLTAPYFELASLYRINRPEVYQPTMAVALFERVLEIDPENAKANLRLCQTFATVDQADFSQAQPYCERALQVQPDYADAYKELGRMQYLRRNYEGSIESFERCIELGSEDIDCWYLQGQAEFYLDNCPRAWELLTEAQNMAEVAAFVPVSVEEGIEVGLFNITELCAGFSNRAVPTAIPPTPIPPTPIGGFN